MDSDTIRIPVNKQEEWKKVLSQICTKLASFCLQSNNAGYLDFLDPLVNAKYLTTLKLGRLPTPETFRQMADNYTCLQNVEFLYDVDCSENSDVAYFLEKQKDTLTSLSIGMYQYAQSARATICSVLTQPLATL
jgi:hypothetical protein